MYVKLFVLGRSGSGKSQTARYISDFLKSSNWVTRRFKDYDILGEMALNDKRFRLLKKGGFDVLDASALDDALQMLDARVQHYCDNIENSQSNLNELIIIEFARPDYDDAFQRLSQNIRENAFFLLIDAEFEECKRRIEKRLASSETDNSDNHNVSNFAMNRYFRRQQLLTIHSLLPRLKVINNNATLPDFKQKLEPYIKNLLHISDT